MDRLDIPLLESKLHAPRRRPGAIPRARLARGLDLDALPAVTLVSAPAGFGKTVLIGLMLLGRVIPLTLAGALMESVARPLAD